MGLTPHPLTRGSRTVRYLPGPGGDVAPTVGDVPYLGRQGNGYNRPGEGSFLRRLLNLETAVGSQKSAHALDAPGKIQKCRITTEVTTTFCISLCTPISYTSFLRPTAVSRLNKPNQASVVLKSPGPSPFDSNVIDIDIINILCRP